MNKTVRIANYAQKFPVLLADFHVSGDFFGLKMVLEREVFMGYDLLSKSGF